jgi:hypothetical protein
VHLIAAEPPTLSLADFVKNVKAQAPPIHTRLDPEWQAGYESSISERNLTQAISYVRCQKQHHASEP